MSDCQWCGNGRGKICTRHTDRVVRYCQQCRAYMCKAHLGPTSECNHAYYTHIRQRCYNKIRRKTMKIPLPEITQISKKSLRDDPDDPDDPVDPTIFDTV